MCRVHLRFVQIQILDGAVDILVAQGFLGLEQIAVIVGMDPHGERLSRGMTGDFAGELVLGIDSMQNPPGLHPRNGAIVPRPRYKDVGVGGELPAHLPLEALQPDAQGSSSLGVQRDRAPIRLSRFPPFHVPPGHLHPVNDLAVLQHLLDLEREKL
jgi:hypothetical protein